MKGKDAKSDARKIELVVTDRAAQAESTRSKIDVGDRVRDRPTGRLGTIRGTYGTGSRRQYLIDLDLTGSTRTASDSVYRLAIEFIDLS